MSIPGAASPLLLASAADEEFSIERSLRFSRDDSAYLNFTPSSAGNRKTWTWSAWVKRSYLTIADYATLFGAITTNASDYSFLTYNTSADTLIYFENGAGSVTTSGVFRDSSAWAHICLVVDTTQSASSDAYKLYVNGSLASTTFVGTYTQNELTTVNSTEQHALGSNLPWQGRYFDGYMAETHFIDGQALAASDFGEYDDNNVWQPKEYSGTYGTNGWHLNFSDATNTTTIAEDSSGNGNDWTANNISVTAGSGNDSLFDSPNNGTQSDTGAGGEVSGNYCTFNNAIKSSVQSSNGALTFQSDTANVWRSAFGTMLIPSSGKWYFEITAGDANLVAGIVDATDELVADSVVGLESISYTYYFNNGKKILGPSNTQTTYGATGAATDVMGIALDMDGGTLTFYKNGTSQGTAFSSLTGSYLPVVGSYSTSGGAHNANFGQRPFAYSAPSGYKCLCSANLPDPTIADGSTAFDAVTYTGDGNSPRDITGYNFSPDLVWYKQRDSVRYHQLYDIVRGAGTDKSLASNSTNAEDANDDELYGYLSAFNSDGFEVTAGSVNDNYNNNSGSTYVAWAWDAGSSTASNTDGSITSSVRANTSTGFSIVSYTGTGSAATVGHGLNATPEFLIVKRTDSTNNWYVQHASVRPGTDSLFLDMNSAATERPVDWNSTAAASSVFSVGTITSTNGNGATYIAYCFAPVEGYSAFGSYTGNGNADGPFVYTGFRPRWIMVKASSATKYWYVMDTERDPDNLATQYLIPSLTNAEDSTFSLDVLSNGFKWRMTSSVVNGSGTEYIYAAFAEHPFKTARAR